MRDIRFLLKTHYSGSRALVIGIDKYQKAHPLSYAVSDATAIRNLLVDKLGFPADKVVFLTDSDATREKILRSYLRFTSMEIDLDERLVVFFAGHGSTRTGIRGEVGYLVPYDGNADDLSTLVRWNELTENSELIKAKHLLFIMDACYGGLALSRNLHAGSARFLKDMLLRYSRQVLTAGKADEVVSDSGGPLPEHSVFSGHLIEGLSGNAATPEGIITASSLMSYVYGKVSTDKDSRQTPSYGHFDGDGDFILKAPGMGELEKTDTMDLDDLVLLPYTEADLTESAPGAKTARAKSLLASESSSIEFHDFAVEEVQRFLAATSEDSFQLSGTFSDDEFFNRIAKYEEAVADLSELAACLAYWAKPANRPIIQKILSRSSDRLGEVKSGHQAWIVLRWYPIIVEFYCSGIAAIAGRRYDSLHSIFYTPISSSRYRELTAPMVERASDVVLEFTQMRLFKRLPGHEKHFTPMSEYLFKILQPRLDDLLFLGSEYEVSFDEFEILFALVRADLLNERGEGVWGPVGRFGWKQRRDRAPLSQVIETARAQGDNWGPIKAGFFGGSISRFDSIATKYLTEVASKLPWY